MFKNQSFLVSKAELWDCLRCVAIYNVLFANVRCMSMEAILKRFCLDILFFMLVNARLIKYISGETHWQKSITDVFFFPHYFNLAQNIATEWKGSIQIKCEVLNSFQPSVHAVL